MDGATTKLAFVNNRLRLYYSSEYNLLNFSQEVKDVSKIVFAMVGTYITPAFLCREWSLMGWSDH